MLAAKKTKSKLAALLAEYPSSEDDEASQSAKRPRTTEGLLPPPVLPEEYRNLRRDAEESRRRDLTGFETSFVEGNWTTVVFIAVPLLDGFEELVDSVVQHLNAIPGLGSTVERVPFLDNALHISLSRPISLKIFEIDRFVDLIKEAIASSRVPRFTVGFSDLAVFNSDTRTRSFIGVNVGAGTFDLKRLVQHIDVAMKKFGHEAYYAPPLFHASIVSANGDCVFDSATLEGLKDHERKFYSFSFPVTEIRCKAGNRTFCFAL